MITMLDGIALAFALLAVVIGVPRLRDANGHSRMLKGLIVIAVAALVARIDTLYLETGWLRAAGSLGITTTVLWLVLPQMRWPRW